MLVSPLLPKGAGKPRFSQPPARPDLMLLTTNIVRPRMTLGDAPIESFVGRWAVALVKWREEKSFAEYLEARGVPYFLPLKRCKDRWRNVIWLALFPSYVFFCETDGESRYAALDSGYCVSGNEVKSVLSCARQTKLRDELSKIRQQQLERPEIITSFAPGAPVRAIAGPWMGREGFIESDTGKPYIVFRSELFGDSSTPFEVPREHVELIDA